MAFSNVVIKEPTYVMSSISEWVGFNNSDFDMVVLLFKWHYKEGEQIQIKGIIDVEIKAA